MPKTQANSLMRIVSQMEKSALRNGFSLSQLYQFLASYTEAKAKLQQLEIEFKADTGK